jgi:hypothetical protein
VDLAERTITVRRNRIEPLAALFDATDRDPKTAAGKRTVAVPPHLLPVLRVHLEEYAGPVRLFGYGHAAG